MTSMSIASPILRMGRLLGRFAVRGERAAHVAAAGSDRTDPFGLDAAPALRFSYDECLARARQA